MNKFCYLGNIRTVGGVERLELDMAGRNGNISLYLPHVCFHCSQKVTFSWHVPVELFSMLVRCGQ